MPRKPATAWIDGSFVPWDQCMIHVRTQAVMTGASVFEGLRAYWNMTERDLLLFRLGDHVRRLEQSMKIIRIDNTMPTALGEVCIELLARNEFREDVHLLLYAYVGEADDLGALSGPTRNGFFVTAVGRPQSKALATGLNVCVSSWLRIDDRSMPPRVKAAANYHNSRLAIVEARTNGYDNAILLNRSGTVAEGTGACIFVIREGIVSTPPATAGILESITRKTLLQLFAERLSLKVIEREIDRTELYIADELFLCGTGAEVTPVISLDKITVGTGRPGPLTTMIQAAYFEVVRGQDPSHTEWCTPVYGIANPT